MEPLSLATILMMLNAQPEFQNICVSTPESRSCIQGEAEWSLTLKEDGPVWNLYTPDKTWDIKCNDDYIGPNAGYCIMAGKFRVAVIYDGYGISFEDLEDCSGFGCY